VIAKFETFGEDLRHIEELANITLVQNVHENTSQNRSSEEYSEYFKQLDREELLTLNEFYIDDFLMFGYSPYDVVTSGR